MPVRVRRYWSEKASGNVFQKRATQIGNRMTIRNSRWDAYEDDSDDWEEDESDDEIDEAPFPPLSLAEVMAAAMTVEVPEEEPPPTAAPMKPLTAADDDDRGDAERDTRSKRRARLEAERLRNLPPPPPGTTQRRTSVPDVPVMPGFFERRVRTSPAALGPGPRFDAAVAAVQKVAKRLAVGPDAWFAVEVRGDAGVALVTARVSRKLDGRFSIRIHPLVGLRAADASAAENTLEDAPDAVTALRRASKAAEAAIRALSSSSNSEKEERPHRKKNHFLYEPLLSALRKVGVEHATLEALDLWEASCALETTTDAAFFPCATESISEVGCAVCLSNERVPGSYLELGCGHWCCVDCFELFVQSQAQNGISRPTCPGCVCQLELPVLAALAGDGPSACRAVERLARWRREAVVAAKPDAAWCPNCPDVVSTASSPEIPACRACCRDVACRQCGEPGSHLGVPCDAARKFRDAVGVLSDEEKSVLYLRNNTRPCPKCRAGIEKNGGCLHMRCFKCSYYFCWACGGSALVCGSFRCRATGVAGLGLGDRVGDGWWRDTNDHDPSAPASWAGIPSDPLKKDADAVAAHRSAVKHKLAADKSLSSSENKKNGLVDGIAPGTAVAAAHFALYLLYLRRWAELGRLDGCEVTDSRKPCASNLCHVATTLEAQLAALASIRPPDDQKRRRTPTTREEQARRQRDADKGPQLYAASTLPEFELLAAQRALDAAIAKSKHLGGDPAPLQDYMRSTVVAALCVLARRAGLARDPRLDQKKSTSSDRIKKPRRPTVVSHAVTRLRPGQPTTRAPWQRGLVRVLR